MGAVIVILVICFATACDSRRINNYQIRIGVRLNIRVMIIEYLAK
jgi:hypothetical protein